MSNFETIAHPQQLGNEVSGCWAARRDSSLSDLSNVDDLVFSNNLLTHTHNRRNSRLSLKLIFPLLCACVMRCHTSIQRGFATHYPFRFRMPVF